MSSATVAGFYGSQRKEGFPYRTEVDPSIVGYTTLVKEDILRVGMLHNKPASGRSYIDLRPVTPLADTPLTMDNLDYYRATWNDLGLDTWWIVAKAGGLSPAVHYGTVVEELMNQSVFSKDGQGVLREHLDRAFVQVTSSIARCDYVLHLLNNVDAGEYSMTEDKGAASKRGAVFVEMDDGDLGVEFIHDGRIGVVSVETMSKVVMFDGGKPPPNIDFETIYNNAFIPMDASAKTVLYTYFTTKKELLSVVLSNITKELSAITN